MSLAGLAGFPGPRLTSNGTQPSEVGLAIAHMWTAVDASGQVDALPAQAPEEDLVDVVRGDFLGPRTRVRTGDQGRATLTRHGAFIFLDPQGELVLPAASAEGTRIEQRAGAARYEVKRRGGESFQVTTPTLIAGVKGAVFTVIVEDGRVGVSVTEGHVQVRSESGEEADLYPGDAVVLRGRGRQLEVLRQGFAELTGEDRAIGSRFLVATDRLQSRALRTEDPFDDRRDLREDAGQQDGR